MGKVADRYFEVHPWKIVEQGFNPAYSEVAESVFSLGNEYTGATLKRAIPARACRAAI